MDVIYNITRITPIQDRHSLHFFLLVFGYIFYSFLYVWLNFLCQLSRFVKLGAFIIGVLPSLRFRLHIFGTLSCLVIDLSIFHTFIASANKKEK